MPRGYALGSVLKCGPLGCSGEKADRLLSVMVPGNTGLGAEDKGCWTLWSTLSADQVSSGGLACPLLLRICSMAWTTSFPHPWRTSSRTLRLCVGNTLVRMSIAFMWRDEAEEGDGSCSSLSVSESEPSGLIDGGVSSPSFMGFGAGELMYDSPSPFSDPEPWCTSGDEIPGTDSVSADTDFPAVGCGVTDPDSGVLGNNSNFCMLDSGRGKVRKGVVGGWVG